MTQHRHVSYVLSVTGWELWLKVWVSPYRLSKFKVGHVNPKFGNGWFTKSFPKMTVYVSPLWLNDKHCNRLNTIILLYLLVNISQVYLGIWLYCGSVSEAHWPGLDWQQDDRAQQARLQLEAGMITWKHTATETQTQKEGEGVLIPEHGGFKVQHCSVRTAVLLRWVKGYWGSLLWYVLWRQTGGTQ